MRPAGCRPEGLRYDCWYFFNSALYFAGALDWDVFCCDAGCVAGVAAGVVVAGVVVVGRARVACGGCGAGVVVLLVGVEPDADAFAVPELLAELGASG